MQIGYLRYKFYAKIFSFLSFFFPCHLELSRSVSRLIDAKALYEKPLYSRSFAQSFCLRVIHEMRNIEWKMYFLSSSHLVEYTGLRGATGC